MKIQKSIDTKEIGAKIKHLRKSRSMTQDELGTVLGGLSRGQVSNLETGRRNLNIQMRSYHLKKNKNFMKAL